MGVVDTGWLTVANGQTTQLAIPTGKIVQARVRWRGRATSQRQETTTSASDSGSEAAGDPTGKFSLTAPDKPGWTLDEVDADSSINQESLDSLYVYVQAPGQSAITKTAEALSWSLEQSSNDPAPSRTTYHSFSAFTPYSWDAGATAHWHRYVDLYSKDPKITVAGQVTQHLGTLTDGQVSDWRAAGGFVAGLTNSVLHNVTGGAGVDVQIEITYIPPMAVTPSEPAAFARTTRIALVFRASPVPPEESSADRWFPRVVAALNDELAPVEFTWDSRVSQTDWYYWDDETETWIPLGPVGAPITTECRYLPPADEMRIARWYWAAQGYDDQTELWGGLCAVQQFQMVFTLEARWGLEIDGRDYSGKAQAIRLVETTNGELGSIQFELPMRTGMILPEDGDDVVLALRDAAGNTEQFEAIMEGQPARIGPGDYRVVCSLPDRILAQRYVRENYASQDVGLTFKAIVDGYCSPLDSSGIDTATGFVRPIQSFGRTALDVAKELRDQYGLSFWVRSTDLKVFLVKLEDLDEAVLTAIRGRAA